MELFWHDVLHAARALIKHRGYSAFAILTLGLGIGANVGMFSVFGWLLSPKLSVPRSVELVEIDRQSTSMQASGKGLSWPMYLEYVKAQPNALPELAAYYPALGFEIGQGNKTVSATVTAVTGITSASYRCTRFAAGSSMNRTTAQMVGAMWWY
jgi:hypothetical protein